MWRGAFLLPFFLLCETLVTANERYEALNPSWDRDCENSTALPSPGRPVSVPSSARSPSLSYWWTSIASTLTNYLPGDTSTGEAGFFNDLRLAFSIPPATHNEEDADEEHEDYYDSNDTCMLTRRNTLYARDQQVLKTKCRVVNIHSTHGYIPGHTPNYTPTGSDGQPLPTQTIGDGHGGGGRETIAVNSTCGNLRNGATVATNTSTGPNGSFDWLTCGINPHSDSTGWNPPFATVDQIITYQGGLRAAIAAENSPYKPCEDFIDLFETAGAEFQVPPLYIAAFALQESGCNPDVDGGGGEQGMMQISPEKCADAPNGDCKDVVYNVRTAVSYFRDVLKSANGNTFAAVGMYNGWFVGMNYTEATTWGINGDCCRCQRNLSYLAQFFNGWLQNIDAWALMLGTIHNTATCP